MGFNFLKKELTIPCPHFSMLTNGIFIEKHLDSIFLPLNLTLPQFSGFKKISFVSIEKYGQGIVSSFKKIEIQLHISYKILTQKQLKAFFQYSSVIVCKLFDQF